MGFKQEDVLKIVTSKEPCVQSSTVAELSAMLVYNLCHSVEQAPSLEWNFNLNVNGHTRLVAAVWDRVGPRSSGTCWRGQ